MVINWRSADPLEVSWSAGGWLNNNIQPLCLIKCVCAKHNRGRWRGEEGLDTVLLPPHVTPSPEAQLAQCRTGCLKRVQSAEGWSIRSFWRQITFIPAAWPLQTTPTELHAARGRVLRPLSPCFISLNVILMKLAIFSHVTNHTVNGGQMILKNVVTGFIYKQHHLHLAQTIKVKNIPQYYFCPGLGGKTTLISILLC